MANRMTERMNIIDKFNYHPILNGFKPIISQKGDHCDILLKNFSLSNHKFEDKWFFTNTNMVVSMSTAFKDNEQYFIEG